MLNLICVKKKFTQISFVLLFVITMTLFVLLTTINCNAAGGGSTVAESNTILSATLVKNKDNINIEIKAKLIKDYVKLNKDKTLYLFEILPYQSASQLNTFIPISEVKVSENITLKIDLLVDTKTRLYSKFAIAEKKIDGTYAIITNAKFIDNPDILAKVTYEYPKITTKKGLQVQLISDAQTLGVGHTVINIPINDYLLAESSDNTISYIFDAKTYYLNKEKVSLLDHKIKILTDAGINIYLNIMLSKPDENTPPKLLSLYYEGYSPDATLYAINTKNQDSILFLEGILNFLAERYTRTDKMYGFAGSFILGCEVNSNRVWNNAGPMTLDNYIFSYITAFRIADTALRSVYSNGKTYISLSNNFTALSSELDIATDPLLDYAAKDFLDKFNANIKYAGNIPWNVAINPYPSDLKNTSFWNDSQATDNSQTQFITMKNIEVLCNYLSENEFKYKGNTRNITISEFGIHADPKDGEACKLQSAAYALAYYKIESIKEIEAFIYHRHVDHSGEIDLNFGLWTNKPETILTPDIQKPIYNIFKYIDTIRSKEVTDFALPLLYIKKWTEMIPTYNEKALEKRKIVETIPVLKSNTEKGFTDIVLFDFTKGQLNDFYPSDNAEYIELRTDESDTEKKSKLYAKLRCDNPSEYMGISYVYNESKNIDNIEYVTIKMKAVAPVDVTTINVMFRLYNNENETGSNVLYEGIAQIEPNNWKELTFQTSEFLKQANSKVDSIKIWIKPFDDKYYEGEYGMWLDQVTVHQKNVFPIGKLIAIIIIVIATIVIIFYVRIIISNVIKVRKNERRKNLRTSRSTLDTNNRPMQNPNNPVKRPNSTVDKYAVPPPKLSRKPPQAQSPQQVRPIKRPTRYPIKKDDDQDKKDKK